MRIRHYCIFLSSFIFVYPAFAEFGKIVDSDGYVNVREGESSSSAINGRVSSGDYVYVNDEKRYKKWLYVSTRHIPDDNLTDDIVPELSGYVHRSRIQFIDQKTNFIPLQYFDKQQGIAKFISETSNNSKPDITVTITTEENFKYQKNKHLFTGVSFTSQFGDPVFLIDKYKGQYYFGTDGGVPHKGINHFQSITAQIGNRTVKIPQNEMESLFYVHLDLIDVYYDKSAETLYISANNADGAATYRVLFVIKNGKYKGKTIVF